MYAWVVVHKYGSVPDAAGALVKPDTSVEISIADEGSRWAIKHNGGTLGHAANHREALAIAQGLVGALKDEGRAVTLRDEPRSFRDAGLPSAARTAAPQ